MTTLVERTRALVWAGGFLMELARDRSLPLEIRRKAVDIARHFLTVEEYLCHGPVTVSNRTWCRVGVSR